MGKGFLIDTNAVIELLGNTLPTKGAEWLEEMINTEQHYLSVINQLELLSFNGAPKEMKALQDFIDAAEVLPLDQAVVQQTITLRKQKKTKLPDAIIAATAMVHDLTLVTRNLSDFQHIPTLETINPHTL